MTHLSLFSGIGGLDLSAEWAGFETVGQCEWADFPTKVLEMHWPDVPKWRDIRTLTQESFHERTGLRTVDVISGGFPCQPFSIAGKRRSKGDDRYLWPEMLRVIREIAPAWVLGENVANIVNLALDTVLSDMEEAGYAVQTFLVPACGVDAPHRRDRVAIVAHAIDGGTAMRRHRELAAASEAGTTGQTDGRGSAEPERRERRQNGPSPTGMADGIRKGIHETDPHADIDRLEGRVASEIFRGGALRPPAEKFSGTHAPWEDWPDGSGIPRISDGVPNRMDRIKALGNAVVPHQFYAFFEAIADEIKREESE